MNELTSDFALRGAPSFLTSPPPVPEAQVTERASADVVIVGEGFAALCCALRARQSGADALIVTASRRPVGRGGSVFAAYSKVMAEQGLPRPDLDKFCLEELEARCFQVDQGKFYRFINRSEEAMNWLVDLLRANGVETVLEDANDDDHDSPTYQPPGTHAFVTPGVTRAGVGITFALKVLEDSFLAAGGRILRETRAKQLEKTGGRVTAVIAERKDGA